MAKAPIGKRVIAYIIDMVLVWVLCAVLFVVAMALSFAAAMIDQSLAMIVGFLMVPVYFIVCFGYALLKDGMKGGRSIGKKVMKLKVVKGAITPCSYKDSLIRNITFVIPVLNLVELVMPFVDAEGLRFGDKIAKTQVVEE
ncbi:MAG: hypothetical protein GF416_06775 [Candidatus Altiarchaeales archaeon]|nr:hypothetical protein [Candidatus Altiarchaeales archaeon]MBD3416817.1 hypothetical protein [Candidatus Altiarchaeales archaeon]